MNKVFIDGQIGTTGLQIFDRLSNRPDIELLQIPEENRKDVASKSEIINEADVVILCLPDSAAKESVELIKNEKTKVLDASTAHRISDDWVYGLPELNSNQRELIKTSKRVSNPGCYPTGFLLCVRPLVEAGVLPKTEPITVNAISGYSGGGKKLINKYQNKNLVKKGDSWSIRPYGLALQHKHVPEMQKYSLLDQAPLFVPSVGDFYQGMLVMIPLHISKLKPGISIDQLAEIFDEFYKNESFVNVFKENESSILEDGFLSPLNCNGTNRIEIILYGNDAQVLVAARLDNLGKGASGAAVQNLNLMIDVEENTSL